MKVHQPRIMERLQGERHLLSSPCILTYSNKTVRSFLQYGWGKHTRTVSLTIKYTMLFVVHLGLVNSASTPWINSLIITLRRVPKTNYRDGVSDYVRLLVYRLCQRLVYRLDLQYGGRVRVWMVCVCEHVVCVYLTLKKEKSWYFHF